MTLYDVLHLVAGVLGTWWGAELLVRGAVRLALHWGVSPMVVGLTVVAFGTSSPEAVVSFVAAGRGAAEIAVGNVLGSNVANIGLILGTVSLLHPIRVNWRDVRSDVHLMLLFSFVVSALLLVGWLGRLAGVAMLSCQVGLLWSYARVTRRATAVADPEVRAAQKDAQGPVFLPLVQVVAGLVLLGLGANWLVQGAEAAALALGIPEAVVGATMVAVGTSLPELAASIAAVVRGQHDIGIGNLVGSNIMNLLFVLGGAAVLAPGNLQGDQARTVVAIMLLFALALWALLARRPHVGRLEGCLLLGAYVAFAVRSYL